MEYYTKDSETGKLTRVYDIGECLTSIRIRNEDNEKRIKYLQEENRKLREEYNKDEEIQKIQLRLDEMLKDCLRGFPITEEEEDAIEDWKKKHDKEVHGIKTFDDRLRAAGCIGGRYSYSFLPTTIGISGKVKCSCGAEFEFQKIE